MSYEPIKRLRHDFVGRKFFRLTVAAAVRHHKNGKAYWRCFCECGETVLANTTSLKKGLTKSCGCWALDCNRRRNELRKAAANGRNKRPEYAVWQSMKARCLNEKRKDYPRYGGRGITVCERWKSSFDDFYRDMGPRPSDGHSLERVDNNKGYEAENCVWETLDKQARNRGNNYRIGDGDSQQLALEIADKIGITVQAVRWRVNNGWTLEQILSVADGRKQNRKNENA